MPERPGRLHYSPSAVFRMGDPAGGLTALDLLAAKFVLSSVFEQEEPGLNPCRRLHRLRGMVRLERATTLRRHVCAGPFTGTVKNQQRYDKNA
jgi:hypothetical protein